MSWQIAIDGPAGAGKSTIAKAVAQRLGFQYIDTGAMYRAITLKALSLNINMYAKDEFDFLDDTVIHLHHDKVYVDGVDVSSQIRSVEVSNYVSIIAEYENVRKKLVEWQRNIASDKNIIMDGRDIGTVVLPDADLKIYLFASARERAKRRSLERQEKNQGDLNYEATLKEIYERDYRDSNRALSPLRKADDAVEIDSSELSVETVIEKIINLFLERGYRMENLEVKIEETQKNEETKTDTNTKPTQLKQIPETEEKPEAKMVKKTAPAAEEEVAPETPKAKVKKAAVKVEETAEAPKAKAKKAKEEPAETAEKPKAKAKKAKEEPEEIAEKPKTKAKKAKEEPEEIAEKPKTKAKKAKEEPEETAEKPKAEVKKAETENGETAAKPKAKTKKAKAKDAEEEKTAEVPEEHAEVIPAETVLEEPKSAEEKTVKAEATAPEEQETKTEVVPEEKTEVASVEEKVEEKAETLKEEIEPKAPAAEEEDEDYSEADEEDDSAQDEYSEEEDEEADKTSDDKPLKSYRQLQVVQGKVVEVIEAQQERKVGNRILKAKEERVLIELEDGQQGFLFRKDTADISDNQDLFDLFIEGDEVTCAIKKIYPDGGKFILSTVLLKMRNDLTKFQDTIKNHEIITAKVIRKLSVGYLLKHNEFSCLLPSSQVAPSEDDGNLLGQEIDVTPIRIDYGRIRLIVSQNVAMAILKRREKEAFINHIEIGQEFEGIVKNIESYGAFVDIGNGIEGLLHISELDHVRISKVEKVLKPGDTVRVKVIKIDGIHIGLSRKALLPNYWLQYVEENKTGTITSGTVTEINNYGLVVQLNESVSAFLPRSEFSWEKDVYISDTVSVGDTVAVKIIEIDTVKRRIILSKKQLTENPWDKLSCRPGDFIKVTVIKELKDGYKIEYEGAVGYLPKAGIANYSEEITDGTELKVRVRVFDGRRTKLVVNLRGEAEHYEHRAPIAKYLKTQEKLTNTFGDLIKSQLKNQGE